ncbi:hypothetical protein EDD85DRAFT_215748 [Armillaria nabsnona]|nr:hypothetical protein EDD85DRAFT_215748 [Armillaria nabsnona]
MMVRSLAQIYLRSLLFGEVPSTKLCVFFLWNNRSVTKCYDDHVIYGCAPDQALSGINQIDDLLHHVRKHHHGEIKEQCEIDRTSNHGRMEGPTSSRRDGTLSVCQGCRGSGIDCAGYCRYTAASTNRKDIDEFAEGIGTTITTLKNIADRYLRSGEEDLSDLQGVCEDFQRCLQEIVHDLREVQKTNTGKIKIIQYLMITDRDFGGSLIRTRVFLR